MTENPCYCNQKITRFVFNENLWSPYTGVVMMIYSSTSKNNSIFSKQCSSFQEVNDSWFENKKGEESRIEKFMEEKRHDVAEIFIDVHNLSIKNRYSKIMYKIIVNAKNYNIRLFLFTSHLQQIHSHCVSYIDLILEECSHLSKVGNVLSYVHHLDDYKEIVKKLEPIFKEDENISLIVWTRDRNIGYL